MQANSKETPPASLNIGEFRLDTQLRSLHQGSKKFPLTPKPLKTLEYLIQNRHRVVSKDELLAAVWGGQREISTVEHAVSKLRQVLGDDAADPRYIETVPGHGYRFIAPVEQQEPLAPLTSPPSRPKRQARWILAAVLMIALAIGFVALPKRQRLVERATLSGALLTALDERGNAVWEHHFDRPIRPITQADERWRIQIQDLDGDGRPEVLAALAYPDDRDQKSDVLYCFGATGKLLWHYEPDRKLQFIRRDFNGPWILLDMVMVNDGKRRVPWISVGDLKWWPSMIVSLGDRGEDRVRFINPGLVYVMDVAQNASGTFVLAGGVNNEHQAASLAILKSGQEAASAPQIPGSAYQCLGCPSGQPYRYFLFPRSEINLATGQPYNRVGSMYKHNGRVVVEAEEGGPNVPSTASMHASYEITPDFAFANVNFGEGYKESHQFFEREGLIGHPWSHCKEQSAPAVIQSWDSHHGWTDIRVPWGR